MGTISDEEPVISRICLVRTTAPVFPSLLILTDTRKIPGGSRPQNQRQREPKNS